jgi:hypothetical protein
MHGIAEVDRDENVLKGCHDGRPPNCSFKARRAGDAEFSSYRGALAEAVASGDRS